MANDAASVPPKALPPRGINHMVLNVQNLEVSHQFWTEIIGFRCVAELKPIPGRQRPKMRFYSGLDAKGDVTTTIWRWPKSPRATLAHPISGA